MVRKASQGVATHIVSLGEDAMNKGVLIGYDTRNFSREFAEETACVFAANGITSYLFDELRPTPELSFAILELKCIAGVNITDEYYKALETADNLRNQLKDYLEDSGRMKAEISELKRELLRRGQ